MFPNRFLLHVLSLFQGLNRRFQLQNGGFSENQLKWLRNELEESEREGERVIVFGHTGIHPDSCDPSCLAYNYDKVLEIFDSVNCVIAYLRLVAISIHSSNR